MHAVCISYGVNPPALSEASPNRLVAESVEETLRSLGWPAFVLALSPSSATPIDQKLVFNLCDGDESSRCGLLAFADELESTGKRYTGSHPEAIALSKDKTLSWLSSSTPRPRWWEHPPADLNYIAKLRSPHGNLLTSPSTLNGTEANFPSDKYFFQEFSEGPELTACFLGPQFLGLTVVRDAGIITRDDKWNPLAAQVTRPRTWGHPGSSFPQVTSVATAAWGELLVHERNSGSLSYGRVDIRLDTAGRAYVIDLSLNAHLGSDGLFLSCWTSRGGTFRVLVREIARGLGE